MVVRKLWKILTVLVLLNTNILAQGICVPDTLNISRLSGKIMAHLKESDEPLSDVSIKIIKKGKTKKIVRETKTNTDGVFDVSNLKPGIYTLITSYSGLSDFYLDLSVSPSKNGSADDEIVIWLAADFLKPCSGSYAELKKK